MLFLAEKADFVLARIFGIVHCLVALFQHFFKIVSVTVISRFGSSADTCSKTAEFRFFRESAVYFREQVFRLPFQFIYGTFTVDDDCKLVASKSCDKVNRERFPQYFRR